VHEVGVEVTQAPAKAKCVRRDLPNGQSVEAAKTDALPPDVSQTRRERQDLGMDPRFAERGHEWPVFTENDVDVDVVRESRQKTEQRDFSAG
jgi:hypothetical protein